MLSNKVNIKKKERKYRWLTVFAWLFLKTIGRILPKRWIKWAEDILYYNEVTTNNEVQTDDLRTIDESVQIDLKPEVSEKESQSEVVNEDVEVQTTFQDMAMQTGCVEKVDKNVEVDLESERERELKGENEKLKEQLEGVNQALEVFIGLCDNQAQQIADLQLGSDFLEEENGKLKSKLTELEKNYRELAEVAKKRGEEFLVKLEEKSKEILKLNKELIERCTEFANKIERFSVEAKEKDRKINSLTRLSETLEQDIKKTKTESNRQQQIVEMYTKLNEVFLNMIEMSERALQLNNREQQEEKKSLENKILELQKLVQTLEGNKEWELAGIDGILKEVFSNTMEILEKGLFATKRRNESLKRQLTTQSTEIEESNKQLEKVNEELEKLTLSYVDLEHQIEELQLENDSLEEQNGELRSRNRKLESEVACLKEGSIQSKIELASDIAKAFEDSERKCMKTGSLTLLGEELSTSVEKLSDQLYKVKSIERQQHQSTQGSKQQLEGEIIDLEGKLKIEQLQKEQKQIEKLEEKQVAEMDSIGKLCSKNKNLERFLSKKNEELKRSFPEFKEKHFLLNFLRKTVKFLSNKQDDIFQGSELLNLLKTNLKESARKVVKNRVKEVVNKGRYYQVSKNIDKELLDGTICRDKLKTKLLHPIEQCMKKLELDVKNATTITNSIVDKFYDKENNNESPSVLLEEIVVKELTEARMKNLSKKVKEINPTSNINDTPHSSMSHTNSTMFILPLGNVRG